jgi:hypothetical protein
MSRDTAWEKFPFEISSLIFFQICPDFSSILFKYVVILSVQSSDGVALQWPLTVSGLAKMADRKHNSVTHRQI